MQWPFTGASILVHVNFTRRITFFAKYDAQHHHEHWNG